MYLEIESKRFNNEYNYNGLIMKAIKHKVTLTIEVLSIDSVAGIAYEAISKIDNEFINGELIADDGDSVKWVTEKSDVEF